MKTTGTRDQTRNQRNRPRPSTTRNRGAKRRRPSPRPQDNGGQVGRQADVPTRQAVAAPLLITSRSTPLEKLAQRRGRSSADSRLATPLHLRSRLTLPRVDAPALTDHSRRGTPVPSIAAGGRVVPGALRLGRRGRALGAGGNTGQLTRAVQPGRRPDRAEPGAQQPRVAHRQAADELPHVTRIAASGWRPARGAGMDLGSARFVGPPIVRRWR